MSSRDIHQDREVQCYPNLTAQLSKSTFDNLPTPSKYTWVISDIFVSERGGTDGGGGVKKLCKTLILPFLPSLSFFFSAFFASSSDDWSEKSPVTSSPTHLRIFCERTVAQGNVDGLMDMSRS